MPELTPSIVRLLDEMTLAGQVLLLSGEDFWSQPAVARLGICKLRVTDGPNGAHGGGALIGGVTSASLPVGITLGASWNTGRLAEVGAALADAMGEDRLSYATGCINARFEPLLETRLQVDYSDNHSLSGQPLHSGLMDEARAFWIGRVADGKLSPGHFSVGFARLCIDGVLVADAWTGGTKGRIFFEEGCDGVMGEVNLVADKPVDVMIEFATKDHSSLGIAAFRAGISAPVGDDAILQAAQIARDADVALVFVEGAWCVAPARYALAAGFDSQTTALTAPVTRSARLVLQP